ncbi:hypothetical protein [Vibrio cholerae]|nr:hypothetical protein [Vibrio cholerae]KFE28713.1 hypothetical protein DN30_563 [Vibrio cholerae]
MTAMFKGVVIFCVYLMIIGNSSAFASTSYHSESLENAVIKLLPNDWSVGYSKPEYRKLPINYQSERQVAPMWASVLDEAGKRLGVAFLIVNEDKKVYVTPIDGFRTAGSHFVVANASQQRERYQLERWQAESVTERTLNENKLVSEQIAKRQNDLNAIRSEYESQLDKEKAKLAQVLNQNKVSIAEKQALLNDQLAQVEKSRASLQTQIDIYERKSASAESEMVDAKIAKQQALQLKASVEDQMQSYKQKIENEIRTLNQSKEKMLDEKESKLTQEESKINAIVNTYYPPIERTMSKGVAKNSIQEFLNKYWKYDLSWSDALLDRNQVKTLAFEYDLNFAGDDLAEDVSKIVCYMTRDIPGITIYSEIDPQSRVVVMQMHKGSFSVRQELIAQCFE